MQPCLPRLGCEPRGTALDSDCAGPGARPLLLTLESFQTGSTLTNQQGQRPALIPLFLPLFCSFGSLFALSPLPCKAYCGKGAADGHARSASILLVYFQERTEPGVTNTDLQMLQASTCTLAL